jgi:large subunit ribosomal protein L21
VLATPAQLDGAVVKAKVVGETRGPKIDGFVYKPKSNNRKRFGHRQHLSVLEITSISGAKKAAPRKKAKPAAEAADAAESEE